ncbi:YqeB family protein [Paenibacillus tuaregi]|uniref:YqeB family protein n=1 Tax=Paenibacillus tuaregi TaxID=1816681 RepID=UPI00083854FA|nr:hypothetical protein [Paenibacillus tuaregi]
MSNSLHEEQTPTELGLTRTERVLILILPPVLGLILGFFIPTIAAWVTKLPWFPFKGPFELIASLQYNWAAGVTTLLGLIAGIWLTYAVFRETLFVTISDTNVQLKIKDQAQTLSKQDIISVFADGKQLVLLGANGAELAREACEFKPAKAAEAFARHGYPWSAGGDPYEHDYRLWVPESPELSSGFNALLKAREHALSEKDSDSAKELQREAGRLGLVIRDKGKHQYWRLTKDQEQGGSS